MSPTLRMTLFIQNYDCWRNTSFQRRVFLLIVYVDPHLDCLVLSIGSLSGTLFQFCKSITVLTANNQEYMYVKYPSILYSNRETKDRFAQCFPSNSYSIYCTNIRPELYPQEYVSSLLTIHHSKYDNIIVLIKKSPMLLKYISFVNPVFCYWRIWWDSLISLFFTFNLWWRELPKSFWEDTIRPMFVSTWQRIRVCRWLKSMFLWFGEWYVEPNH